MAHTAGWHRSVFSVGRRAGQVANAAANAARAVDSVAQNVALPAYRVARPVLRWKGYDTSHVDRAINSYNSLRQAVK